MKCFSIQLTCVLGVAFFSCGQSQADSLPPPPFVVNCGPATDEAPIILAEANEQRLLDRTRLVHIPDLRYRARRRYGHRRGEGYRHWHEGCRPSLGPPWESDVFASGRVAPGGYAFALPNGSYYVTLGICEGDVHATGQRVFDILVGDTPVVQDVDPIAWAGYKEPLMLTTSVDVEANRPLTISFRSKSERPPIICAIWVTPVRNQAEAQRQQGLRVLPPTTVRVVGSYGANIVSWHRARDFSVAGFAIRRRTQGEEQFQIVTPQTLHSHRWIDRTAEAGTTYVYQVGSRDTEGSVSWSNQIAATPRLPNVSSIPRYAIQLPDSALRLMLANVHEERTERGTLELAGKSYPIELRIRGASTRYAAKKSYRIRFIEDCPFARKVTYLKAEPMDHTMQQEKLSCDLFRAAKAFVSEAEFVNLFINDHYEGVYLDMEPVRSPFKKNEGLHPEGTLIRASTFQTMEHMEELGDLRGDAGNLDQLRDFIQQINHTPRGDFDQFVRERTDWPRVRDYLALIALTHRTEIEANDYFFYRAPDTAKWSFVPWDHNNGNFHVQAYGNRIGEPYIHVFPQTVQQLGWQPNYAYVLPSRIFQTSSLRDEYLARLEQLTNSLLVSGKLESIIDDNFQILSTEYPLDPHRWPFTGADPFDSSADELKSFVRQHARHILQQIRFERDRPRSTVVINEFQFDERSGWVELYNQGNRPESLRQFNLVVKDDTGNWRLSLQSERRLQPGEHRTIQARYRPIEKPQFTDAEAREQWELERWRERDRHDRFPGFSPEGGFIGLVRHEESVPQGDENLWDDEDDDRKREHLLDFYFYGPQRRGKSYGRTASGFAHQSPTPGSSNSR